MTALSALNATHDLALLPRPVQELIDATDHLYARRCWLAVEEDVADDPPVYVWTGDSGPGFAAAYRFDERSNPWPIARLDLFLTAQGRPGTGVLPSYLIGGRRPGHSRFLVPDGAGRAAVLHDLIGAAARAASERGAATVAALYCDDDDEDLAAAFAAHGGVKLPSHATYVLDLPGASWADWIASLTRKQRLNETADVRKLADSGVGYVVRPLTEPDIEWIVPLEMGLYQKYGHDYRLAEASALHRAYLTHLGDDALVIEARRDGTRVGFASLVRAGDAAGFVRQCGFDTDATAGAPVYFGAVYHTAIRWAYENGVRMLDFSISAGQVKRRRGATELSRSAWIIPLTEGAGRALR
jgi:hypothetical protein